MNFSIIYSQNSKDELKEITIYYFNYTEEIARRFLYNIRKFINDKISFMPEMFRIYKNDIRLVPYWDYLIFYKINHKTNIVEILHIIHWARELSNLKF